MKVKWLRRALKNLDEVYQYVEQNNPVAARAVLLKIQNAINNLVYFPMMGKQGRVEGTRELFVSQTPYIIIYKISSQTIIILRILHSSRRYPN